MGRADKNRIMERRRVSLTLKSSSRPDKSLKFRQMECIYSKEGNKSPKFPVKIMNGIQFRTFRRRKIIRRIFFFSLCIEIVQPFIIRHQQTDS